MTPFDWLRAIAVWSPLPTWGPQHERVFTVDETVAAVGKLLAKNFQPEAFNAATVRLAARQCDTFPNYYWCCRVLEGAGFPRREYRQ